MRLTAVIATYVGSSAKLQSSAAKGADQVSALNSHSKEQVLDVHWEPGQEAVLLVLCDRDEVRPRSLALGTFSPIWSQDQLESHMNSSWHVLH